MAVGGCGLGGRSVKSPGAHFWVVSELCSCPSSCVLLLHCVGGRQIGDTLTPVWDWAGVLGGQSCPLHQGDARLGTGENSAGVW